MLLIRGCSCKRDDGFRSKAGNSVPSITKPTRLPGILNFSSRSSGDTPPRSPTRRPVAPTAWRLRARRPCFGAMRVLLGTFVFLAAGFCVSTILCQELQLPKTTHRHAIRRRSLQQDMPWGPRKTKKANSRYVGNRSAAVTRDQLFGNHATRSGVPQAVGNWHGLEHRRDGECPGPQKPIRTTKTRSEFGQVMEEEGFRVGVELGVKAGDFALVTLRAWKSSEEYWLVDLWAPQENYKDEANVDQRGHNAFHAKTMQKMKPFMSKVKVCRDYTTSCLKNFEDGSLDYVFVDARHDYKGALEDMENYWPKLRCGGILAGHDYMTQEEVSKHTQQDWTLNYDGTRDLTGRVVKGAVDDFAAKYHRQVVLTYREAAWNSWMIRK